MNYKIIGGDKKEYGPSTSEELKQWILEGRLNGESYGRLEPDGPWQPIAEFPEFAEALQEQARKFGTAPTGEPAKAAETQDRFSVPECLGSAWQLWMSNFILFSGACFMVWTTSVLLQFLPLIGLLYYVVRGVLYGGLFILILRRLRGQDTSVGEAFSGFGHLFTQLVLAGLATSFLTWAGFMFCVIPGIYLLVAWMLTLPIVADQGVDFWTAMERSRKVVSAHWAGMFVLGLVAFLPAILTNTYAETKIAAAMYEALRPMLSASKPPDISALLAEMNRVALDLAKTGMPYILATKVALLLNLPFGLSAIACAYEALIGKSSKRRS